MIFQFLMRFITHGIAHTFRIFVNENMIEYEKYINYNNNMIDFRIHDRKKMDSLTKNFKISSKELFIS